MSRDIRSLADVLHPLSPDDFFAEYYDNKPLHLRGGADKFASVLSWPIFNGLLNMTSVWSGTSLQLVLDREVVPPARYCRPGIDRNNVRVLQPDPPQVAALLRRGASLVANDVDTLSPGLAAVADALEAALSAKAQANVYCSWRQRQAFDSHYDTHDVFAIHVEGEKVWRIYQTRVETPIAHPLFKSQGQEHHDRAKGEVLMEVALRPGDLLYLPRGQYHDALASSAASLHVSFGLTAVIGIDVLDLVRELAIADPEFRANLPREGAGERTLGAHLARLARRLGEIVASREARETLLRFRRDHRYRRGGFDLPGQAAAAQYQVRARGLEVVQAKQGWHLRDGVRSVPIPPGADSLVSWVIARERFSEREIAAAFPDQAPEGRAKLLGELAAMKVIEPV